MADLSLPAPTGGDAGGLRPPAAGSLKEPLTNALKAAGVVLLLTIPLVGFQIVDVSGGIRLDLRFGEVAAAVVVAFLATLAVSAARRGHEAPVSLAAFAVAAVLTLILAAEPLGLGAGLAQLKPFANPVMDAAVVVFAVGFGLICRFELWKRARAGKPPSALAVSARRAGATVAPGIPYALLSIALAFPFLPIADQQLMGIAVLVMTYIMLGWGLNVVVGLAGLLDLGYVAFFAVGAYSFAILAQEFHWMGFWVCLPLSGLMAALAGVILGFPVLRLRGDYLAIVTLGFGEIIRLVLLNWFDFTNGPQGIGSIPKPSFFGLPFLDPELTPEGPSFHGTLGLSYDPQHQTVFLFYIILALALLTNRFVTRMRRLPIGRAWEAMREDEIAAKSLGINTRNTKLTAFSIGAMLGGFAGSFFATRQGFISPESFSFIESAIILAIVVLGGFGSQLGVVLAAVILVGLPEYFRPLQEFRMLTFGLAMVLIMLWRPGGLLAHRDPTIRLHPKGTAGGGA